LNLGTKIWRFGLQGSPFVPARLADPLFDRRHPLAQVAAEFEAMPLFGR